MLGLLNRKGNVRTQGVAALARADTEVHASAGYSGTAGLGGFVL